MKKKENKFTGYYLRILKFLCKRQNKIRKEKNCNPEFSSIRTSVKKWGSLLNEIEEYRGKPMKATSLERSLRELKKLRYIVPVSKNLACYIVSPEGFKAIDIEEEAIVNEKISLPPRDKNHINICCRFCNITDGYLPEENVCKYCGNPLYGIDRV